VIRRLRLVSASSRVSRVHPANSLYPHAAFPASFPRHFTGMRPFTDWKR